MADLQAWFAPLLWIIATITAIVAFVRLCKPVWKIFTAPDRLEKTLKDNIENINSHFDDVNKRLDKYDADLKRIEDKMEHSDEVQMSLLHDQIIQIYEVAKLSGEISDADYKRATDLYKQDGGSEYIDNIMELMAELFKESQKKRLKEGEWHG